MGATLTIVRQDERFAITASGWHFPSVHLSPIKAKESDFVAVAEMFLDVPYLWGGKTIARARLLRPRAGRLRAAGIACPRDSDMQELELGDPCRPRRACGAATWCSGRATSPSHATQQTLLHANAHHMAGGVGAGECGYYAHSGCRQRCHERQTLGLGFQDFGETGAIERQPLQHDDHRAAAHGAGRERIQASIEPARKTCRRSPSTQTRSPKCTCVTSTEAT